MSIKNIYGVLLTILGIGGLIYTVSLVVDSTSIGNVIALIIYTFFCLMFFTSGMNLMFTTKKELTKT